MVVNLLNCNEQKIVNDIIQLKVNHWCTEIIFYLRKENGRTNIRKSRFMEFKAHLIDIFIWILSEVKNY